MNRNIEDLWKYTIDDLLEVRGESKSHAELHPRPDEFQANVPQEG
jgi:hypothetical protein